MKSKKELCQNWKLYLVTSPVDPKKNTLSQIVREAIAGGVSVIQLRDKSASDDSLVRQAQELLVITKAAGIALIINDRIEVAKRSGADGVHLGQEDRSLAEARLALGDRAIVGRSTHSPEQALRAQSEGFDYIGVGPVFATPTKPTYQAVGLDLIQFASKNIHIPFVAIGGIDESNVSLVKQSGARTVAVVRAIMNSKNPKQSAQTIQRILAS